jgi:hypothetical protein
MVGGFLWVLEATHSYKFSGTVTTRNPEEDVLEKSKIHTKRERFWVMQGEVVMLA